LVDDVVETAVNLYKEGGKKGGKGYLNQFIIFPQNESWKRPDC